MLLYTPLEQFQVLSFFSFNLFYFDLSFTNILLVTLLVFLMFLFKHCSDNAGTDEGYETPDLEESGIQASGTPEAPRPRPSNGIIPVSFPELDEESSNTDEKQSKDSDKKDTKDSDKKDKPDKSDK